VVGVPAPGRLRVRGRSHEAVRSLQNPDANVSRGGTVMSKLLRGMAAGYGAKKLGGGCFSTVIIFLILWWLLGHFRVFQ
jgi:hypothetical protein